MTEALIATSPGAPLDQIAEQLRAEISSLEEHIQQTSDRFLATEWVRELLDPFEQLETELDRDEIREAVQAMYVARARFKVNGHLAERIDAVLERHQDLVEPLPDAERDRYQDVASETPEPDQQGTDTLFEDEEADSVDLIDPFGDQDEPETPHDVVFTGAETLPEARSVSFTGADELEPDRIVTFEGSDDEDPAPTAAGPMLGVDEDEPDVGQVHFVGDDEPDEPVAVSFGVDEMDEASAPVHFPGDDDEDDADSDPVSFNGADDNEDESVSVSFPGDDDDAPSDDTDPAAVPATAGDDASAPASTKDLFKDDPTPKKAPPPSGNRRAPQSKQRTAADRPKEVDPQTFAIFSDRISLDDLQAGLDITVPPEDLRAMENQLRARLTDRVVNSLRAAKIAEGQYILIPRIARFVDNGNVVPCTVKNLVRKFHQRFGEIRELMKYRNESMMTSEIPQMGWGLITAESPRESLGKNYMEQNQYLRYLATSLQIPSHLLRRRTMVEAVYDLIVAEMVLGRHIQRQSLDWTASSPAKNDFVCVYTDPAGIRVRDLSRTTRHPSLGVSPNW